MELSARSLEKRYGSRELFSDLSFVVEEGHKVAVVGENGVGKSTLLRILAGIEKPDNGTVTVPQGKRVKYLPQEFSEQELAMRGTDYLASDEYPMHQAYTLLRGFGMNEALLQRPCSSLSGGQQTKLLLTRFLLEEADVLLLDEPTNNLDLSSLIWLEQFLEHSKRSMLIVSHDVDFLDAVTQRVFILTQEGLTVTRGAYSAYLTRMRQEKERQTKEHRAHQEERRNLEEAMRSLQTKGHDIDAKRASDNDKRAAGAARDQASTGQGRVRALKKQIAQLELTQKPFEGETLSIPLEPEHTKEDIAIVLEQAVVGYEGGTQVGPISCTLPRGARICVMGANGEGKSTFLKTIQGDVAPRAGSVLVPAAVRLGDFMQHHERVVRDAAVFDFFQTETGCANERSFHLLKKFGIPESTFTDRVASLSPGARARLLFAIFVALRVNVLLLDEPTNHLDIGAVQALIELLKTYRGTVLLVSHNRWFLRQVPVTEYYVINDGVWKHVPDLEQYLVDSQKRAAVLAKRLRRMVRA